MWFIHGFSIFQGTVIAFTLSVIAPNAISAQTIFGYKLFAKDTIHKAYYEPNDSLLNIRLYVSEKLTSPTIVNRDRDHTLFYKANSNKNLGIGATYGWLTINIGLNFKFVNHDDDQKGRTRYLDLHSTLIGRSYAFDFFGQFYNGAYLMPASGPLPKGSIYPQRPDLYTQQIGFTGYYFTNWQKFSYSAAAIQRDWQKKSAGSPMLGVEFFTGRMVGDSSLIPRDELIYFSQGPVDKVRFVEIAFGGGYAYTLVIKKHWFMSASAVGSLSAGLIKQFILDNGNSKVYLSPNIMVRPSFGYNSKRWNGSVMLISSRVTAGNAGETYRISTSNLRVTMAYRMLPKGKNRKKLDNLLNVNPNWRKRQN